MFPVTCIEVGYELFSVGFELQF